MKPRITVITLGVDDLQRSLEFNRDGLGFLSEGIVGQELSLGHNVHSKHEVDAAMPQAMRAGAKIAKPAQETFWGGYAGYFQDPDGHLWEVAWNPAWESAASKIE